MENYPTLFQEGKVKNRQDHEYIIISEDEKSKDSTAKDYLDIIKRRKWHIIFPLFLIIPITLLYVASERPMYKATTRLIIEDISPKSILIQGASTPEQSPDFYHTQYALIKSRAVIEEVVQALQDKRDSAEIPREIPRLVQIINTIVSFPEMIMNKIIDSVSEVLSSGGAPRKDSNMPPVKAPNSNNPRLDSAITRLKSRLPVEPVKDTKLVDISLQGSDPLEVVRQVDMVADVYARRNLESKLDITRKAISWLKREIDTLREKIKIAQSSLQEFNESKKLIFNENNETSNIDRQQLDALNSSYVEIHTLRIKVQATLDDIDKLSKKNIEEIIEYPIFLENQIIRLLRTKYIDLKTQYSSLSNIYKGQHPKIAQITSEMEDIKDSISNEVKRITNSMQKEYKALLAKEENIKKYLRNQQSDALNVNKYFAKYNETKRDIDIDKEFYTTISKKLAEALFTEVLEENNVKIVERAQIPKNPIPSSRLKKILLGMILGLGFGWCFALIVEHFDKRFKTIDDAERELEIPFLGFIPHYKIGRKEDKPIALQDPHSIAAEAYRNIRTWIQLSKPIIGKTLLITSAIPREGKSTTAANLAISFAQLGSAVLLVDADLRRPRLDRIFKFEEGCIGLTEVLMLGIDWKEAIQNVGVDNLKVLLTGIPPSNPTEILSTMRMKELIQTWRECFDIIIFDSPIMLSISDVAVLASEMDSILLIYCPSKTGKGEIVEAARRLRNINANMHGIVFNNVGYKELRNYYSKVQSYNGYYSSRK